MNNSNEEKILDKILQTIDWLLVVTPENYIKDFSKNIGFIKNIKQT